MKYKKLILGLLLAFTGFSPALFGATLKCSGGVAFLGSTASDSSVGIDIENENIGFETELKKTLEGNLVGFVTVQSQKAALQIDVHIEAGDNRIQKDWIRLTMDVTDLSKGGPISAGNSFMREFSVENNRRFFPKIDVQNTALVSRIKSETNSTTFSFGKMSEYVSRGTVKKGDVLFSSLTACILTR